MRIQRIKIKNFRAFRNEIIIDLKDNGHNLLLYGENGSGKSSLYQAMNYFISNSGESRNFIDFKNIFLSTNEGYVVLTIGLDSTNTHTYEWEESANPFLSEIIIDASKTKGFIDYKTLLATNFIHNDSDEVNVYDLIMTNLLVNYRNPISNNEFKNERVKIGRLVKNKRSKSRTKMLSELLDNFNQGLVHTLDLLSVKTNELLKYFDKNITVKIELVDGGLKESSTEKKIVNQRILLKTNYFGLSVDKHHHFFNEARLSAIAISIFFSKLLLLPSSALKIVFLDDVLIGLDMSNRLPLLDILKDFFSDWQIFITTYDHVWFSMIRKRIEDWSQRWECAELYCEKSDEGDIPIFVKNRSDYLAIAETHLSYNDLKAAAIYIRSAYEYELKRFANKHGLHIRYCENPKDLKADYFWNVIKSKKLNASGDILNTSLISEVELLRSSILNQLSHTAPVTFVRAEVEAAKDSIRNLKTSLEAASEKIRLGENII